MSSNTENNTAKKIVALKIICALFIVFGLCVYLFSETMTLARWTPSIAGLVLLLGLVIYDFNYIAGKMNTRSFKYSTNAIIYSIIVIFIVIVINFIIFKHDRQWDLTQNKRYSLSEQSVKVLKNLKSDVEIKMFYPDITKMQFNDLFKQYSYHSDKFKVEYYDLNKNPKLAQQYQITESQTAVIKHKDKTEKLYGMFGEQELTNAIIRASRAGKKSIYFTTGHNEADCDAMTEKGMSALKDALTGQNYEIKKINLTQQTAVPTDCSALIIAGPVTEFLDIEINAVSNYLDAGGKVFTLLDIKPAASLEKLLGKYGIEAGPDLVIDPKPALKMMGLGDYTIPLGMIYDSTHTITKDFNMATIHPLVRSINIKTQMNMVLTALAKTSPESYADKTYLTENNIKFDPGVDQKGPITVVAACSKIINEATPVTTSETALKSDPDAEKSKKKELRLVVAGTSNIARNRYINLQGNGSLVLNILNYLAEEEDLIAIKPKTNTPQEKIDLSQQDANNIFYLTLFLMPGFVVLSGFTVWFYRNK
ncbi:MAG: ABC-type uncharacterized transport system [bacterium ADurb.Bin243]|nr:MAG: ABC-type uncharacterized transport system [bacterium ADurb.Bin243]